MDPIKLNNLRTLSLCLFANEENKMEEVMVEEEENNH